MYLFASPSYYFLEVLALGIFWEKATTTPAIKIIPESDGNFFYYSNLYGPKGAQHYINSIKRFLNTYDEREYEENIRYCDFNHPRPENRVCAFDIRNLGACSQLTDFGYSRGRPCFYFTLSQVSYNIETILTLMGNSW